MQAFFMQHELFRVGGAHRLQTSRGWVLYSAWDVSLQIDALQTVRVILNKSTKTEKSEVDALVSGASNSNGKIRPSLKFVPLPHIRWIRVSKFLVDFWKLAYAPCPVALLPLGLIWAISRIIHMSDPFACATRLIHMSNMSRCSMRHIEHLIRIYPWHMTHSYVWQASCICGTSHSYVWQNNCCHVWVICVACLMPRMHTISRLLKIIGLFCRIQSLL